MQEIELSDISDVAFVDCTNCGASGAEQYCAVTPVAFITDLMMNIPTTEARTDEATSASSIVAAPKLENTPIRSVGGANLMFSPQGQVFKVSQRANGKPFQFSRRAALAVPRKEGDSSNQTLFSRNGESDIWQAVEASPELEVKFSAPKTTDLLGVRVFDDNALSFFDQDKRLAARRAAWYSAATILQRAIALELDVDSTSIEIASVHLHRTEDAQGAELYLADEHPNGAGLVSWANDNWESLLSGCVEAQGDFSQMGRFLIDANHSALRGHICRNPDALLTGFRNNNIHGLIDWQLGIDLLSVIRDKAFIPGFSESLSVAASSPSSDWGQRAESACNLLARALGEDETKIRRLESQPEVVGVLHADQFGPCLLVVAHPLWSYRPNAQNIISNAINSLLELCDGCQRVRLVDTFNIERRVSWVRKNVGDPDLFPIHEFDGPRLQDHETHNFAEVYENVGDGDEFEWDDKTWIKVPVAALWTAEPGKWLVIEQNMDTAPVPQFVNFRRMQGEGSIAITKTGARFRQSKDPDLKIVAKPSVQ